MSNKAVPQNPMFEFPERIWKLNGGTLFKDSEGQTLFMGYIGPTPGGKTSTLMVSVANDHPSHVHPAEKYIYQRYAFETE